MTFVIKLTGTCTDTTLPTLERDPLLSASNDGVRFLFDAAFPYSYAGGNPVNGTLIRDISGHGNGQFVSASGAVGPIFAGGGFDFSTMTTTSGTGREQNVESPTGIWSGIAANQNFLVVSYMKLPTLANWNVESSLLPVFAGGDSSSGYISEPDPVTISLRSGGLISARRQTSIGNQSETTINPALHYGLVTQIAFWRTGGGLNQVGLQLTSSSGVTSSYATGASPNSASMATVKARWGSVTPFTAYHLASHRLARNRRLYRGWVENLALSGRDPIVVLRDDWDRVVARGAFS